MAPRLEWTEDRSTLHSERKIFWATVTEGYWIRLKSHHNNVRHSWCISLIGPGDPRPVIDSIYVASDPAVVKRNALKILLKDLNETMETQRAALAVLGETLLGADDNNGR